MLNKVDHTMQCLIMLDDLRVLSFLVVLIILDNYQIKESYRMNDIVKYDPYMLIAKSLS